MKIYHKKNFVLGIFFIILGIALLAVSIQKGFDVKGMAILVACFLFGEGFLIRSLSRGFAKIDQVEESDERNQLIKLRSRNVSFLWSEGFCGLCLLGSMLGADVLGKTPATVLCCAFGMLLAFMLAAEFIAVLYYEQRI